MRLNKKNSRTNLAVAEILGSIIMLGIATTSLSGVSYYVLSAPAPIPAPIVEMSGMMDDNQVIVTHCGGEPLDLDTELVLNIGGSSKSYKVGDFLDSEAKEDGFWGLSEKFVYPLGYDFDYLAYPDVKINVVDKESNSLLLSGPTKINPICDISIEIAVDNLYPKELENVELTITATNEGNINASRILIEYLLTEGLTYFSSTLDMGTYDSNAGIWDIDQLSKGESAELKITATVKKFCYGDPTQLVFILDGSGSISPESWNIALEGLSNVIGDNTSMPHNGAVELTVIQFGGKKPAFARLEIGPIVVTEHNAGEIVDDIRNIIQIGDRTPTSCGVYLAADTLYSSDMFNPGIRQIVFLVTDGNPTHCCSMDGSYTDAGCSGANGPKEDTVDARNYLIDLLKLTPDEDEFNVFSVDPILDDKNPNQISHVEWLKEYIVWPEPSYYAPPYILGSQRGWLRNVSSWSDLEYSINASFEIIFNRIPIDVSIKITGFFDPKSSNDISSLVLEPTPSYIDT